VNAQIAAQITGFAAHRAAGARQRARGFTLHTLGYVSESHGEAELALHDYEQALALRLAWGDDKGTPLKAEVAKLKKERVPQEQLETAKREAAEAEATRDAAVAKAGQDEAAVSEAKAELERQRAALQHETDRNLELRKEIDAHVDSTNAAISSLEGVEAQATERRRQLTVLRDQAKPLAKAMRPDDPSGPKQRGSRSVDFARTTRAQLRNDRGARARMPRRRQPEPAALVVMRAGSRFDRSALAEGRSRPVAQWGESAAALARRSLGALLLVACARFASTARTCQRAVFDDARRW
jgi:hypothetical protein